MRSCTWILAILLIAVPAMLSHADDGTYPTRDNGQERGDWVVPDCDRITGTRAVTYTTDEGLTMAATRQLTGIVYTHGLVTLDVGNTLLASSLSASGTSILRSEDAGCNWTLLEQLPEDDLVLLAAGPGDVAYGWARGRNTLYRIEGNDVVTLSAPTIIYGLAVDPTDAAHIRVGASDCQLYESFDGGANFVPLGGPANSGSTTIIFTVEFDPTNFDHALCGAKGAYRTQDAGQSWSTIPPFDFDDIDLVYLFEFSPSDPGRVWARANLDTMVNRSKEILVSNDGGATFATAFVEGEQVVDQDGIERIVALSNQLTMAAHADDPDVLYFTWPALYCCPYEILGVVLARYDLSLDALRAVYIDGLHGIDAMAFNPAAADVIYLGLESERLPGKQL